MARQHGLDIRELIVVVLVGGVILWALVIQPMVAWVQQNILLVGAIFVVIVILVFIGLGIISDRRGES